jgi:outer membrane protein OmpA-like peptidoglycan-associated protein
MATNLLDMIKGLLTPDVVSRAGALVGESPTTTQRALEGSASTVLAGLMRQSEYPDGPAKLLGMVSQYGAGDLTQLSESLNSRSAAQTSPGHDILSTLFGGRLDAVSGVIARFSGAKSTSAMSLLSMAAPLVLRALGRVRGAQGLDAHGLTRLLSDQRDAISRVAPPGLADALGLGARSEDDATVRRPTWQTAPPPPDAARSLRWIAPLAVLGLVLAGLWWTTRTPPLDDRIASRGGDVGDPTAGARPGVAEELATLTLPDGNVVRLDQRSALYGLARYLGSSDTTVPRRFAVDRLSFETGSTQLTADSSRTVDELSKILHAYPSVRMQLQGYTDSTGNPDANQRLSVARAETVRDALTARGVEPGRVQAAGQGEDRPVASNDDETGRAQNRRLEAVVVEK